MSTNNTLIAVSNDAPAGFGLINHTSGQAAGKLMAYRSFPAGLSVSVSVNISWNLGRSWSRKDKRFMKLYSYFRSSAAYRVRIALNLKGLDYEIVPVHLMRGGGENNSPDYLEINPLALVPALQTQEGPLIQSLAILEYLEEVCPSPALLPQDPVGRARVRAIAQTIASEIHPLNNLRVLDYLAGKMGADESVKLAWYRYWIHDGLSGIEKLLSGSQATGNFCHGDAPSFADCCLVPQVYNARRFDCPLDAFPLIRSIVGQCETLPAFRRAAPENQPDAE